MYRYPQLNLRFVAAGALALVAACGDRTENSILSPHVQHSAEAPSMMETEAGHPLFSAAPSGRPRLSVASTLAQNSGLNSYGTRADLLAAGTAEDEYGFEDYANVSYYAAPNPWTTHGVTYTSGSNVTVSSTTHYRSKSVVLCHNYWTPIKGQIGDETNRFRLFGFDLTVLGRTDAITLVITTNKRSYTFSNVAVAAAAQGASFFGFTTPSGEEYFTGFQFSSKGSGSAPCIDNVIVGSNRPADTTAPAIVPTVIGTSGDNGWYTSDVSITWNVMDAESNVTARSGCDAASVTNDTHGATFACSATSAGGTATQSVTIKRDAALPVISYTGNAGTYTVDQTVAISCAASDAMSGIASDTCRNVSGAAYSFNLGSNTFSATASDNAGNTGSGSTTFTVNVTSGSLCTLTRRFVSQQGIANALCQKLDAAAASAARGNDTAKDGQLKAFVNQVQAQTGKAIATADAATLIRLANAL